MSTMTQNDLRSLAFSLLHGEVLRLAEYDARRYENDVLVPESYSRATPDAVIAERAAEWEARWCAEHEAEHEEVSAHLHLLIAKLARKTIPLARVHLRSMGQQAPKAVASALRALLVEHQSSASALLVAYFTMKDCIEWQRSYEGLPEGSEDRFRDEVAELYAEPDSPDALGAMVRDWVLPPKAAVARKAAFEVVVQAA